MFKTSSSDYTPPYTIFTVFNRATGIDLVREGEATPFSKAKENEIKFYEVTDDGILKTSKYLAATPPNGWMAEVFNDLYTLGWPGRHFNTSVASEDANKQDELFQHYIAQHALLHFGIMNKLVPIHSAKEDYDTFYERICNGIVWELLHNFHGFEKYLLNKEGKIKDEAMPLEAQWAIWRQRMEAIAETWLTVIYNNTEVPNHYLWIQDYHHLLLANTIKKVQEVMIYVILREIILSSDETVISKALKFSVLERVKKYLPKTDYQASPELLSTLQSHPLVMDCIGKAKEHLKLVNLSANLLAGVATQCHGGLVREDLESLELWFTDQQKSLLSQLSQNQHLGFFLHTPFPNLESWQLFLEASPDYAHELLEGLMENEVITFHCTRYRENLFAALAATFEADVQINPASNTVLYKGRKIFVDVKPIGINFEYHSRATINPEIAELVNQLKIGNPERKVILSMSRLDPPKGIVELLRGIEKHFSDKLVALRSLKTRAERGEDVTTETKTLLGDLDSFTLLLQVIPSRETVPAYAGTNDDIHEMLAQLRNMKSDILIDLTLLSLQLFITDQRKNNALINEINLKNHALEHWQIVHYINKGLPPDQFHTLQMLCDGAIIPPQIDGLNLTIAEIAAAQAHKAKILGKTGIEAALVVGRGAGICEIIGNNADGALIIEDPKDPEEMARAISRILTMPPAEKTRRSQWVCEQLKTKMNLEEWKQHNLDTLNGRREWGSPEEMGEISSTSSTQFLTPTDEEEGRLHELVPQLCSISQRKYF